MSARLGFIKCLLMLAAAFTVPAVQAAAEPVPKLRVAPLPDKALIGQVVPLELAVLVPGWFTAPIELPASFVLDGATVRLAEGSNANLNERIERVSYAGIRRRYELVATRAGTFAIPPITVRFQWSNGTQGATRALTTPPLSLHVGVPPGMEGLDYFIAAPRFELTQTIDRPLTELKVGDAFTRTLTLRATGMPAMQLPALQPTALAGLAVYPDEPLLETRHGERGAADQSLRRQRLTYVLQAEGQYELPGIDLTWFDTTAGKVRVGRVSPLKFIVLPDQRQTKPAPVPSAVSPAPTFWRARWLEQTRLGLGSLGLLAALFWIITRRVHWQRWLSTQWQRFATPERRAFRRSLLTLLRTGDAVHQLQAIDSWRVVARASALAGISEPLLWQLLAAVHGPQASQRSKLSRPQAVRLLWRLRSSTVLATEHSSLDQPIS